MIITDLEFGRFSALTNMLIDNGYPEKADADEILSLDEIDEYFNLLDKVHAEANYLKLEDIESEAEDRVWYCNSNTINPEYSEETRQHIIAAQKRIIEQYNINSDDKCDEFYRGYWSGVLALSRFLSGYFTTNIEDLRSGKELLDII